MRVEEIVGLVAISHLALLAFLLRARRPRFYYALGLLSGAACFLLLPLARRLGWPPAAQALLGVAVTAAPFFLWLLARSLRDEGFRPGLRHWSLLALAALVSLWSGRPNPVNLFLIPPQDLEVRLFLLFVLPSLFALSFTALAFHALLRDLGNDLVDDRKRLRVNLLFVIGLIVLGVALLRLVLTGRLFEQGYHLLTSGLILACCYYFSARYLSVRSDLLDQTRAPDPLPVDERLLGVLTQAFEKDKIYREERLTIRRLSEALSEPEHHLRRLINGGLGFRNFNDFLNRYRVQEACELLVGPESRSRPIIRIAMDLGYASPGSFNKAFKEIVGKTPTEYRDAGVAVGPNSPVR